MNRNLSLNIVRAVKRAINLELDCEDAYIMFTPPEHRRNVSDMHTRDAQYMQDAVLCGREWMQWATSH